MMRARLVGSVFSVIAALAVAVPLAHAGGGPGKSLPNGTTACRVILNGGNVGQVMHFVTGGTLALDDQVAIGSPVLICDISLATAHLEKGADLLTPCVGPNNPAGCGYTPTPGAVVCYAVPGANKEKDAATITTPFGEQAVNIGGFGLVCVSAQID